MKVSVSGRPEALLAAIWLAAHLPFLAPSLEDYDSINFALGLRDFDPARHQPHPPGSPVYIVLGRALLAPVSAIGSSLTRTHTEALTLALWSAIAGAIAIVALASVLRSIAAHPPTPSPRSPILWAVLLLAASPLFWLSGLRPMSDLPGLAAALTAQALILRGRTDERPIVVGALVAGLGAGIRIQTVCLTFPLLGLALWHYASTRRTGSFGTAVVLRPIAAFSAGVLVWAVPMVLDSGGIDGYLAALGTQAEEDFAWVNMLWLEPTPRRLAFAFYETFVLPWGSSALAGAVAVAAAAGAIVMIRRERSALVWLLVAFAPYAIFHLLFQETIMVRYALPTLPLVAWLAARGVAAAGRLAPVAATALVAASLVASVPTAVTYGSRPHPAFQAIADASRYADLAPPAAVYSHHSVWRVLQAEMPSLPVVEPPRQYEWLGPVGYWKSGGTAPVWFFADPRRTDLALIDPQARLDVVRYQWAVADRPELSGLRPVGADWYRMSPPGWFAEKGWALTPETGGLARASGDGPDHRPIEAWVRRGNGPLHLMVGGRHLGEAGDPDAEFELALDGVVRDRWSLSVAQRTFLRFLDLPDGTGAGPAAYARLTIASRASGGNGGRAEVGVRQFDVQPAARLLYGFGEGWHEDEYDAPTGLRWRWTSERSVLQVKGASGDVRVTLRGESPLRYLNAPPTVRITTGGRVIAQFAPEDDFDWSVTVPAADLARADGAILIETAPVYLPGPAEGTTDERRLGLRVFECRVYPVAP